MEKEILETIIKENKFTDDTLFYRYTSTEHVDDKGNGKLFLLANNHPAEMVIDSYQGGHSVIANNIGPGLAFLTKPEEEFNSEGRICVTVRLGDILNQGGLIYKVTSVPEYVEVYFFTIPEKRIEIKSC